MTETAYLNRFPADHRETADSAYNDGFADGGNELQTLKEAARALLDAFGGLAPDYLRDKAAALENALAGDHRPPLVIGITMEGGIVQDIFANRSAPGIMVRIVDYDTDGADEADLSNVRQTDGSISEAFVREETDLSVEPELTIYEPGEDWFDADDVSEARGLAMMAGDMSGTV